MIEQAIQDFAASLGLRGIHSIPREPFILEAEDIGRLTLLASGDRLLLGLTRGQEASFPDPGHLLAACHFRHSRPWLMNAQMRDGRYGFYVILQDSCLTSQSIASAFAMMAESFDQLNQN